VVDGLVAVVHQPGHQVVLQLEAGMVGAQVNTHGEESGRAVPSTPKRLTVAVDTRRPTCARAVDAGASMSHWVCLYWRRQLPDLPVCVHSYRAATAVIATTWPPSSKTMK
jgi:hypothetical protein